MSHFQRRSFMLHSMKYKLAARKTVRSDSRRKHSYWYFLSGSDGETLVCKTFYLTTLGFERSNDKSLMNALKSTAIDSNTPGRDGRRRAPSAKKIDQSTVTAHIKTFNPAVSHYRREHAPHRWYLPSDVTVQAMHADFISKHNVTCSYKIYREIVHDMKIYFVKLGNKECDKCEKYNLHDPNHQKNSLLESCNICQNWTAHTRRAREARKQYRWDADENRSSHRVLFSADLEKVVMLPRIDMFKTVLFTRRIIAFNESFVPVGGKQSLKPMAVIWHEAVAGQKKEDIISVFHEFFTACRDTEHIVLWLDNCTGQNKNWGLLSYLVYLAKLRRNKYSNNQAEISGARSHFHVSRQFSPSGLVVDEAVQQNLRFYRLRAMFEEFQLWKGWREVTSSIGFSRLAWCVLNPQDQQDDAKTVSGRYCLVAG